LIAEVLANPELRDTRPEPATDYPPEMITFFSEVRSRLFGSFRVIGVEPRVAVVLLDGDTLVSPGGGMSNAGLDLPVGTHAVSVRAPSYKDLDETITISPGATLERSYRLEQRRSGWWYATRWAGAGVLAGLVALAVRSGGDDAAPREESLPGPPGTP